MLSISITIPIAILSWEQFYSEIDRWNRNKIWIIQNELYNELKPAWTKWEYQCWIEINNDNAETLLSIIDD